MSWGDLDVRLGHCILKILVFSEVWGYCFVFSASEVQVYSGKYDSFVSAWFLDKSSMLV